MIEDTFIKMRAYGRIVQLPKKLKEDLDVFYDDMVYSSMDIVIGIDGKEGTGKSFTARVIGAYLSAKSGRKFNADNIHLLTEDYINFSENGVKYQVNILDESREALGKLRTMGKGNVKFTNWLSENRDKHQVHILLLPAIHDLSNYISTWRMSFLIHHVKKHIRNPERPSGWELVHGHYRIYENNKELQKYIFNRSKYGYNAYPKQYKYEGRIISPEPFSAFELKKYERKKAEKRKAKYAESGDKPKEKRYLLNIIKSLIKKGYGTSDIAKMVNVTVPTINKWIKTIERERD